MSDCTARTALICCDVELIPTDIKQQYAKQHGYNGSDEHILNAIWKNSFPAENELTFCDFITETLLSPWLHNKFSHTCVLKDGTIININGTKHDNVINFNITQSKKEKYKYFEAKDILLREYDIHHIAEYAEKECNLSA